MLAKRLILKLIPAATPKHALMPFVLRSLGAQCDGRIEADDAAGGGKEFGTRNSECGVEELKSGLRTRFDRVECGSADD
jgi:hypothetical protein